MTKTALIILVIGYVFVFFSIPFLGVDILIDAVGFLLLFNGYRAFRLLDKSFKGAASVSLALVVVAALQLFVSGTAALILLVLRQIGMALLYVFTARGFVYLFNKIDKKSFSMVIRLVFGAALLLVAVQFALQFTAPQLLQKPAWAVAQFVGKGLLVLTLAAAAFAAPSINTALPQGENGETTSPQKKV